MTPEAIPAVHPSLRNLLKLGPLRRDAAGFDLLQARVHMDPCCEFLK